MRRYALTDLDTESYYVIEGRLVESKEAVEGAAAGTGGDGYYRLPHAIGAVLPFLKLAFKIAIRLLPDIAKFLKLLGDPTKFITDLLKEKLESFTMFSKPSMDSLQEVAELVKGKNKTIENSGKYGYSKKIRTGFNTTPFSNLVHVDQYSKDRAGEFKFLLDGTGTIPFDILGKSFEFGMEIKMKNLIPDMPNVAPPTIPKSISSNQIPTGLGVPKVEPPIKFVFSNKGKSKTKGCDGFSEKGSDAGKSANEHLSDLASSVAGKGGQDSDPLKSTKGKNKYSISTWYSTGEFKQGVDYNYYYVTDDTLALLKEIDELVKPGKSPLSPPGSDSGVASGSSNLSPDVSPDDLALAKERLSAALSKDPSNQLLKERLKEINIKLIGSIKMTQPIIKMALGLVSSPLKIIACILEWIMDFFKSLVNPMVLPKKIIEFLSFKWIMNFFSPMGLMKTFGINFNPAAMAEFIVNAKISAGMKAPKIPDVKGVAPSSGKSKQDMKSGIPVNKPETDMQSAFDGIKGRSFPIADMQNYLFLPWIAPLPTYTVQDILDSTKLPFGAPFFNLASPSLCFIEKIINGFIDFVWSLMGIEAIIPAPHIKICKDKDPTAADALNDGKTSDDAAKEDKGATEIVSTNPYEEKPLGESFVYEVTLQSGEKKIFKDYEGLKLYMEQNKDISFDQSML
jgi:hypothetical protein